MKLFTSSTCAALPAPVIGSGYALRLGLLMRRDPFRSRAEKAVVRGEIRRAAAQLKSDLAALRTHHHRETPHAA